MGANRVVVPGMMILMALFIGGMGLFVMPPGNARTAFFVVAGIDVVIAIYMLLFGLPTGRR